MVPSFEKRVRGFAIDTSAVAVISMIGFYGIGNLYLRYVVVIGAFIGVYFLPYVFSSGQTFGKRIEKTRIVMSDGSPASLLRILMRDLFKVGLSISTFGLYLVIAFFVMSENTSQTIHDRLFKTKVIDLQGPQGKDNFLGRGESMRKRGL
jgi:uncharacterized RDD family membrane protein YckC